MWCIFVTHDQIAIYGLWWIDRVVEGHPSFKISPRTLIYVRNWCSYDYILVHLQFSSFFFWCFLAFYSFDNIFVSFYPNIMIFGTFWREFEVLPKTGLNRSLIGPKTAVFIGLLRSWSFPVFRFSGLSIFRSFAVQSWSGLSLLLVPGLDFQTLMAIGGWGCGK